MDTPSPGPRSVERGDGPSLGPRPLNLLAHGAVVLVGVLVGAAAAASTWGDIGGAVLRGLFALGAFSQVLLVPLALLGRKAFAPLARRGPIAAHAIAAVVGFAPFLVASAVMLGGLGVFLARSWSAQSFGCRNFAVTSWSIAADRADPKGSVLEVTIRAKRQSGVRLSFVNSYAADGRFSTFERREREANPLAPVAEDPFFHLAAGAERTFRIRLRPQELPTAWIQFTLCTKPGMQTAGCAWFGYGDERARPSDGPFCALPAPTAAVSAAWSRQAARR